LIAVDFIAFVSVGRMVTELLRISSEDFRPCCPDDFHYFGKCSFATIGRDD
jgi:hypothetical protein